MNWKNLASDVATIALAVICILLLSSVTSALIKVKSDSLQSAVKLVGGALGVGLFLLLKKLKRQISAEHKAKDAEKKLAASPNRPVKVEEKVPELKEDPEEAAACEPAKETTKEPAPESPEEKN